MSTEAIPEDIKINIQKWMRKENINDYEVKIESFSERGSGFLGDVVFLKIITGTKKNRYNVIMKTVRKSEELRNTMPVGAAFRREIFMYSEVFPAIEEFLKEKNSHIQIDYLPKCYWTCDEDMEEALILENMKHHGYKLWDKSRLMNLNNAKSVMKILGKHHGISLAFKDQKPDTYKKLVRDMHSIWNDFAEAVSVDDFYRKFFVESLELLENSGRTDLVEKFKSFEQDLETIVYPTTPEEDQILMCHGDCWIFNMIYRYEDENPQSLDVCLLDFQLSHVNTPVNDLSLFIFGAGTKCLLDNLDMILETYYSTLSDVMRTLGSNPDDIFSFDHLKDHWNKYCSFGFAVAPFVARAQLLASDEAPEDLTAMKGDQTEESKSFLGKMKNQDLYNQQMIEIFTYFGENCL